MSSLFCVAEIWCLLFERPREEPPKTNINLRGRNGISMMSSSWNCNDYIFRFFKRLCGSLMWLEFEVIKL
jgi:hypothetical protein